MTGQEEISGGKHLKPKEGLGKSVGLKVFNFSDWGFTQRMLGKPRQP